MILYVMTDVSDLAYKIILPRFACVCDGLFIYESGGHTRLSASGTKGQQKRKGIWNTVKAPLWHKHKRNRPCLISLNCCLGVRQSPFRRLCGSRHTSVQNPFGRWCTDGQNRFYGKARKNKVKKSGRFCLNLPFYLYFCT